MKFKGKRSCDQNNGVSWRDSIDFSNLTWKFQVENISNEI